MHDGISFEQLGKRAVVLCTHPFEVTAKNIARIMGLPDYPFVLVEHPIGSRTLAEIKARAEDAYQQALAILGAN
ncbi:MAG: hypothetical protein QGI68_06520 [Pseudomonadales bacterium]|nr:hypothetical protein [Pseudomonadales bacterium]MDP7595207.1 hypothetical protein [Pseudomonadales bacterium]HJN53134.1 hypothetical protein [Pseudomonadales bacterium]